MKKIRSAHIVAIVFGIFLIVGISGFFSIDSFLKPIYANILSWTSGKSVSQNISSIENGIENVINENVGFRTSFIQANGLAQRLMGKRVIADADPSSSVVRLDNDYLVFVEAETTDSNLQSKADSLTKLKSYLDGRGTELLYVAAPTKVNSLDQQLPDGISDYSAINHERFCSIIEKAGVDTLNLIEKLHEENVDWYSMFFKTDHHWTNEAGFWAYTKLASHLETSYGFDVDDTHLDINSYTVKTYKNSFLGSLGKRTGSTYSGVDDISFFIPKFETSFEYYRSNLSRSGKFEDSLLFEEKHMTKSLFDNFCYSTNLDGDFDYIKITNNLNPEGKKILLIKDSYADPVATHLALDVSQLEIIDLRLLEGEKNLTDYVEESNPDIVIILYSSQQLFKVKTFEFGV